mgnify:CR=1 FL=1
MNPAHAAAASPTEADGAVENGRTRYAAPYRAPIPAPVHASHTHIAYAGARHRKTGTPTAADQHSMTTALLAPTGSFMNKPRSPMRSAPAPNRTRASIRHVPAGRPHGSVKTTQFVTVIERALHKLNNDSNRTTRHRRYSYPLKTEIRNERGGHGQ